MIKLIAITQGAGELVNRSAQDLISYTARVSNPNNQENYETAPKLLAYLIKHGHWSPFEICHLVLEIKTSRMIAPQILRHRSFAFQEFSQRYQAVDDSGVVLYEARRQDKKNKQNSIDDLSDPVKQEWEQRQIANWKKSFEHYVWALDNGIAKECARAVLPLGTSTTLYMSGSIRSWIHFIQLRTQSSTQKEHRDIADACKRVFCQQLPDIAKALEWDAG